MQKANSGHPGAPMGMADMALVLWTKYLRVDPTDPEWPNRDRFVLSNGHASMSLYSLLHLSGFPIAMEDIVNFRQWGYPTAGHPERERHLGIETTTGPLGQGFGNGVGMAMAEQHLRAVFGPDMVDHRTFGFVSDGDLMEGVASEAASLAAHLGLGKLIYYFDDNSISLDGPTEWTFTEDVQRRFDAYGWHTISVDGHDRAAIVEATDAALADVQRPSLVLCRTHIAHGSPNKQDTASAHGNPLGDDEITLTKGLMGWPVDEPFRVPDEVRELFATAMSRNREHRIAWETRRDGLFAEDEDLAEKWASYWSPQRVRVADLGFEPGASMATRAASGKALNDLATKLPGLMGGSADLAGSTKTDIDGSDHFGAKSPAGRNVYFGVREHGMGAAVNGMALHGGVRPYGGTFLVFSDYMRGSVRLSALMGAPSIWIWTHDSVFLGEDGPTHQPVEHLMALRAIPNLWVFRPADATETAEAWEMVANRTDGPCALVLTRQGVPILDRVGSEHGVARGGYVLRGGDDMVLVATGSEVSLALGAAELLAERGTSARVVSLPCWEVFLDEDEAYRDEVLGEGLPIASIEAGVTSGWQQITGRSGLNLGIDRFGASAPYKVIADHIGFTPEGVAERVEAWLAAGN